MNSTDRKKIDKFFRPLILVVLASLLIARFYRLDGGIVLGEPDEVTHQEIVDNFRHSPWPVYSGGPWYYELPFYPFLGYFFSLALPQRFVALRVVSVLSTLLLIFGVYHYLARKVSRSVGVAAALFLYFSPLAVFYSRLGLLDATAVAFSFLSMIFFELSLRNESKWREAILAGLLLSLAIMVKYSALVFLVPPLLSFVIFSVKKTLNTWKGWRLIAVDLPSFLLLLVTVIIVLPAAIVLWQHDHFNFKNQLLTNLGILRDNWWRNSRDLGIQLYTENFVWWLTWPILLLSVVGLLIVLKRIRSWLLFLSYFLLVIIGVVYKTPFYPRYLLGLVPFLAVLSALAWDRFSGLLKKRRPLLLLLLIVFLVFGMLPTSLEAFKSSRHNLVESGAGYLKSHLSRTEGNWIFSTYWPNFFSALVPGFRVGWLADSAWETSAFNDSRQKSSLDILRESGGVVIVEDFYSQSRSFQNPPSRIAARETIEKTYLPSVVIEDKSPNFPFFHSSQNRLSVFLIGKK